MGHNLEIAFRRRLREELPSGSTVLAAVSGGGDSIALLHLLARSQQALDLTIHVAHLDHGMRRGSIADRKFVESLCRELKLPCHAERRPIGELRRKDESLEEAARRVRRAFLIETAKDCRSSFVLTAHTVDDQAETILMRWVRGGGPRALSGMAVRGPGPFLRLLLDTDGETLRNYLRRRELEFREDPTNADEAFDRNRVRRRVLPFLQTHLNPRASQNLVRGADLLRADALYLDRAAEDAWEGLWSSRGGALRADAGALAALPDPIRSRLLTLALRRAGADARRIRAQHVAALEDLLQGGRNRQVDLPGGLMARLDARRRLIVKKRE